MIHDMLVGIIIVIVLFCIGIVFVFGIIAKSYIDDKRQIKENYEKREEIKIK